jgi:hypothetical protein
MWLKKVRPRASVILVEPDPAHLAAGLANFKRNGFAGEFIQAAVGRGQLQVDAFRAGRQLGRLDILHVDIQGYEVEMLEGCACTPAERRVDYLFVSTHSQTLHEQVVTMLNRFGYRIELSSDFDRETTANDGLVFASNLGARQIFHDFRPIGRTELAETSPQRVLRALWNILGGEHQTVSKPSPSLVP